MSNLSNKEKKKLKLQQAIKLQQLIKSLKQSDDLLEQFKPFKSYDRKGLKASLCYSAAPALPKQTLDWALELTRKHMKDLYDSCHGWSWNDCKKLKELGSEEARYIIALQQPAAAEAASDNNNSAAPQDLLLSGHAVGFIHFRFEIEEDDPVLYVYEIQVDEAAQGKGLGRFLMQLVELVARKNGLSRVMLTVFHDNKAAMQLYKSLGYVVDASSPSMCEPEAENHYEILTKRFPAAKPI